MNKLIVGTCFLGLGLSVLTAIEVKDELRVEKNGVYVQMKILEIPECRLFGRKSSYRIKLDFQGKQFELWAKSSLCKEYRNGDTLQVKYLEGSEVVLLPNDNPKRTVLLVTIMAIVSLIILTFQWLQYKKTNRKRI